MPQVFTLRPREAREWMGVLERSCGFDFYHTPGYHALAEARGEGEAWLVGVEAEGEFVAVPLLVRAIAEPDGASEHPPRRLGTGAATAGARARPDGGLIAAGLEARASDPSRRDATSVYGYPGPVASRPDPPAALLTAFRDGLTAELRRRGVVAVFSRLHPLLAQEALLAGLGEVVPGGETVSIDLTLPAAERRRRYRANHRRDLERLRRDGLACAPDPGRRHLDAFLDLYRRTLERVGGGAGYDWSRADLERLLAIPEAGAELIVCSAGDGGPACAGVFLYCGRIAQYHLSGTAPEYYGRAPLKLLLDAAAGRAAERGAEVLHLGGGVGGADDALLHFKRGFSDRRHRFATWRWVVDPAAYRELCRSRGVPPAAAADPARGFFPAYREPAGVAREGVPA